MEMSASLSAIRFVDGVPMMAAAPPSPTLSRPGSRGSTAQWAAHVPQAAWYRDGEQQPPQQLPPAVSSAGMSAQHSVGGSGGQRTPPPGSPSLRAESSLPSMGSSSGARSRVEPKERIDPKKKQTERENGWDLEFTRGFSGGGSKLKTKFHSFPLTAATVNKGLRVRLKADAQKLGRCTRIVRGAIGGRHGTPPQFVHLVGMRVQRMGAVYGDAYSHGTLRGIVAPMHAAQNGPHAWVDKDPAAEDLVLTTDRTVEGMRVHLEREPEKGGKIMKLEKGGQWCLVDFPAQATLPGDFDEVERSEDPTWRETFKSLKDFTLAQDPVGPTWVECIHLKATALAGWVPLIRLAPRSDEMGLVENDAYKHYRGQSLVKTAEDHVHVDSMGWVPLSELAEDYNEVRYLYRPDYGRAFAPSRKALLQANTAECCGFRGHVRKTPKELEEESQVMGGGAMYASETRQQFRQYEPREQAWARSWNS